MKKIVSPLLCFISLFMLTGAMYAQPGPVGLFEDHAADFDDDVAAVAEGLEFAEEGGVDRKSVV